MDEKLFLLDNSSDSEVDFKVNEKYANSYNLWRNKEELQKYKALKKDDNDSESSSESEEEIPEFDEEFFRALSLLKGKDPRIYDKNFELFKNKEVVKKSKTEKQKPMYMKDYERNLVLQRSGKFSDEEDEDIQSKLPTYDEELQSLKNSFKEALKEGDDNDDDDDLLQVRTKTKKEEDDEEADYMKWLKGEEKEISEDMKKDMSFLRNYWNDPELDEGEKFLRDYILNKRYLEKDDSEIPTYEEITSGMLSDDEKMIAKQEKFEYKYNFRFEEPDEEFIKRYPRTVGDSLRKADNRRKQRREEKTERKKKEKEQRKEELKRLKALKRKEIEEKFIKLKEVSGQEEINLNESDMESDFDPDKHDKKMREMFNDDYYQIEEDQKPEFPHDEELDSENWNSWKGEKIVDDENNESDSDEICEISEQNKNSSNIKDKFEKEMIETTLPKKKVRKKSLFAKIISQPKPIYDPNGKSFEDYLDEYYKLDYEDIIGDMPVRYKYRNVTPNNFGLTVDEILAADDRELNRWCSVKKTCQYRNDDEELYDVKAYEKKAQNLLTKKNIFSSLYIPKDISNDIIVNEHKNKNNFFDEKPNTLVNQNEVKEENLLQASSYDSIEIKPNENFCRKSDEHGKKFKMHKSQRKLDSSLTNTKHLNKNPDKNINLLHMSDKYIKETYRQKQNIPNMVSELDSKSYSLVTYSDSESNTNETHRSKLNKLKYNNSLEVFNLEQNTSSTKRKRKFSSKESGLVVHPDSENDAKKSISSECKVGELQINSEFNINETPSVNSDCIVKNCSQEPSRKKKKKKKKNKKNKETSVAITLHSSSQTHKFKDKRHIDNASGDKRLGLSNERLSAYGINPKKFKNRIIYSKK